MTTKQPTFAERAIAITNRYKKRLGDDFTEHDSLAERAMNRELEELRKEQEAVKAQKQEAQLSRQMKRGGMLPRYDGNSTTSQYLPVGRYVPGTHIGNGYNTLVDNNFITKVDPMQVKTVPSVEIPSNPTVPVHYTESEPLPPQKGWLDSMTNGDKVSMISQLGTGIAGTIAALSAKKPKHVSTPDTPVQDFEKSNLDTDRLAAKQEYIDYMRSARQFGANYTPDSVVAGDQYANQRAKISETENNLNVKNFNDWKMQLAGIRGKDLDRRAGLDLSYSKELQDWRTDRANKIGTGITNIGATIASTNRDVNANNIARDTIQFTGSPSYSTTDLGNGRSAQTFKFGPGGMHGSFIDSDGKMTYIVNGQRTRNAAAFKKVYDEYLKTQTASATHIADLRNKVNNTSVASPNYSYKP